MIDVIDLDGHIHKWSLSGGIAHGKLTNKSDLHIRARELLKQCFPTLQILEEISIPIRKSEYLYLDFYLPLLKTCIEAHGEQHYKYIQFYHNDIIGFMKHKKRDASKIEWCQLNNIRHIELPFNETIAEWTTRIINDRK